MHVVSTCEELAWPWTRPESARAIDDAAQKAGVAVLGTGVNPGFLMDALPLFLTAPCQRVDAIRVERVQDASNRRRPFQDKVGVGMSPDDVRAKLAARTTGHVGLGESAAMLGARLGLDVAAFTEDMHVVVADVTVERAGRVVNAGEVLGVEQIGRATNAGGAVVVELYFRATFGQPEARDRIVVDGSPPLDVTIKGGVPGDVATAAIVANAIRSVVEAKPGLRTMADVPLVAFSR
jgi:4-hydroxy-tetrahydrodipicolinate reductase